MSDLLGCISSSSKLLVTISKDNRIYVWDTDFNKVKRVYVEKNHLAHQYLCFDWSQPSGSNLGLFAVGCSDGSVLIWDFARGIVISTFSNGTEPITSVAFSSDPSAVFVSNNLNYVNRYDLSASEMKSIKIGKRKVQKLTLNPKVDVLAVAR
jgi:WD40 repeat protein